MSSSSWKQVPVPQGQEGAGAGYAPPQVIVLGSLAALTAGGNVQAAADGFGTAGATGSF